MARWPRFYAPCIRCLLAVALVALVCDAPTLADKPDGKSKSSANKGSKKSSGSKHGGHGKRGHSHHHNFFGLPFWRYEPYNYRNNQYAYPYRSFDTVYPGYSPYRYSPYIGGAGLYGPYPLIGRYTQPEATLRATSPIRSESLAIGPQATATQDVAASSGSAAAADSLDGPAWQLLLEGRTSAALEAFGNRAAADASDVTNRVGYAMASAATGNLASSVRAMRRACAIDAHAIYYAKLDPRLVPLARSIAAKCESPTQSGLSARDAAFLRAGMHLLTDEPQRARLAIDRAMQSGDRHSSALALRRAIYEQLGEEPGSLETSSARP